MAAPSTPTGLTVDKTASNAVKLSWNNVTGETGFHLWKSYDSGSTYECVADIPEDTLVWYDMDCGESTEYYYKISAYNNDGESALSTAVNTTTLAKNLKYAWVGKNKVRYDANAIYRRDTVTQAGARSETVFIAEEDANEATEILRYNQLGISVAPADATYVVLSLSGSLSNERVLTAGDAIDLVDAGAGSTVTVSVDPAASVTDASESHDIVDPSDSPANADVLRDDLVTNTIPSIEDALNALGEKINAIISSLKTAKLMETV